MFFVFLSLDPFLPYVRAHSSHISPLKSVFQNSFSELRKVANHPLLLQRHYTALLPKLAHVLHCEGHYGDACTEQMVLTELTKSSDVDIHLMCQTYPALKKHALEPSLILGSAKMQKLQSLLELELLPNGHRVLIFSQFLLCLDLLELMMQVQKSPAPPFPHMWRPHFSHM